jgi:ABC-type transport system involved in multi-copper enzyme maturation permease subunit
MTREPELTLSGFTAFTAVVQRMALQLIRDYRFAIFGCGAVVLFVASTCAGVAEYSRSIEEYTRLRAAALRQSALESVVLIRIPSRFLFMSEGGEQFLPQVLIALPGYVDAPHTDVAVTELLPRGLPLDWSFAVAYLFSLAILMSTHDAIARQRQDGTLRVLLSYPVKRVVVLLGEFAGTLAVTVPLLLVAFLGGVAVVLLTGQIDWHPADWVRFGLFVFVSFVFLSFVAAAGLMISILFREPTTCLLVGTLCWVICGIALPAIAQPLAHFLSPAQAPREQALELETAKSKFQQTIRVSSEMLRPIDTAAGLTEEQKNQMLRDIQLDLVRQHEETILAYTKELMRIRAAYLSTVEKESELSKDISLASPMSFYVAVIDDIAGAGVVNQQAFQRAAIEFDRRYTPVCRTLRGQLRPLAAVSGPYLEDGPYRLQGVDSVSYEDVPYDHRLLPSFSGYEVPLGAALRRALLAAMVVLGLDGLFLWIASRRFNRYVVT